MALFNVFLAFDVFDFVWFLNAVPWLLDLVAKCFLGFCVVSYHIRFRGLMSFSLKVASDAKQTVQLFGCKAARKPTHTSVTSFAQTLPQAVSGITPKLWLADYMGNLCDV